MKNLFTRSAFLFFFSCFALPLLSQAATVVFLGDSITEGYGVSAEQSYPSLVAARLQGAGLKVEVVNAGISGSTSASALGRAKWLMRSKPDLVVLALGANDGLRGLDLVEMRKNLAATIHYLQSQGVEVLLAGMKVPPNYGKRYSDGFQQTFPALAREFRLTLIPFLLEGVAGEGKLNINDGIHPNAAGHKVIANTVAPYVEKALRGRAPTPSKNAGSAATGVMQTIPSPFFLISF